VTVAGLPDTGPVLVTGGAGFIGSHVVDSLARSGHTVRVLDPAADRAAFPATVERHCGSILDPEALETAMAGATTVFHMAAVARLWHRNPAIYEQVNHQGTLAVLEAARRAVVQRLVVTSTALVLHGWRAPASDPVSEHSAPVPLSAMAGPYSRSKWRAEQAVQQAIEQGLPAALVYPTVPIGPPGPFITDPTEMLRQFLQRPPSAFLDTALNLVDVRDVAEAHIRVAGLTAPPRRLLLAGDSLPFTQLLELTASVSGRPMPRRRVPYSLAAGFSACSEGLARLTGRPPAASVEGVRWARHPRRYDAALARETVDWQPAGARRTVLDTLHSISVDSTGRGQEAHQRRQQQLDAEQDADQ